MHDIEELIGVKRIHLMGIGGAGMSALALLLSNMGFKVDGCDLAISAYTSRLENAKIECFQDHSPSHIEKTIPQLVVYSSALKPDHEELIEAQRRGIRTAGRGEVLSWLFNAYRGIGVAGTHGKTTTSSMIGLILERSGRDPTLAIGAEVHDIGTNARIGGSDLFVAEIDESDGSFEYFMPALTVVTNVDWDHVNYFQTQEDVLSAFIRFSRARKPGAPLVICAEDNGSQSLIQALCGDPDVVTCGWGNAWNWGAFDVNRKPGGGVSFSVSREGKKQGEISLSLSGDHNVMNALVACAAACSVGVDFADVTRTLSVFQGARRRLEKVGVKKWGENDTIEIIDDYGHHPTEISASLSAMRDIYPDRRIVVAFQPHRYTRTRAFYREIAIALESADVALLLPIYAAGEDPLPGISSDSIIDLINAAGGHAVLCGSEDDALRKLDSILCGGDVLMTLGAGNISGLGDAYLKRVSLGL